MLWKELLRLTNQERLQKEAGELMKCDEAIINAKTNDIELLNLKLNIDMEEIKAHTKRLKIIGENSDPHP